MVTSGKEGVSLSMWLTRLIPNNVLGHGCIIRCVRAREGKYRPSDRSAEEACSYKLQLATSWFIHRSAETETREITSPYAAVHRFR